MYESCTVYISRLFSLLLGICGTIQYYLVYRALLPYPGWLLNIIFSPIQWTIIDLKSSKYIVVWWSCNAPPLWHIKSSKLYVSSLPTTVWPSNLVHFDPLVILYQLHPLPGLNTDLYSNDQAREGVVFVNFTAKSITKTPVKIVISRCVIIIMTMVTK